jgi:hypothetical protein
MTAVTATARRRAATRLDPIAAGWGGLTGGIGLLVGSPRDLGQRVLIVAALSVLGGFLAGVRAINTRIGHAVAAWWVSVAIYVAFVLLTWVVDLAGGPGHADMLPDGARRTAIVLGVSAAGALLGGALANSWLRPGGQSGR